MLTRSFKKAFTNLRSSKVRVSRETPMREFFVSLWKDERGATAIEYGLIAALIAVAAVTVMGTVGTNLSSTFNTVANNL